MIRANYSADDGKDPVLVAMTGGVFRHASLVRHVFYNELKAIPRAQVKTEVVDPVEGALRMARKASGHVR